MKKLLVLFTLLFIACCSSALVACGKQAKTFKLSFMFDGEIHAVVDTAGNESITFPNEPTKSGFAFVGWFYDNETFERPFTEASLIDTALTSDMSVYAKMLTAYDITYVLNGGENSQNNPSKYTVEDAITFESSTKTGYSFVGWYKNEDCTEKIQKIEKGNQGNVTIYAKYDINRYTITFNSNGGTSVQAITQDYATTIQAPTAPTKDGFEFEGWFIDEKFSTKYSFNTMPAENITLFAKWKEILYLRVDENGEQDQTGDYIMFGKYPQTDVTENAESLGLSAGTLPTSENGNGWTSYGYYIDKKVESFMWYKDVEKGSDKYRAVYFTSYRPYYVEKLGSAEYSYQDDNGYDTSNVYWFKYEWVKWKILEEDNNTAFLLCEMIIDSQAYQTEIEGRNGNYYVKGTDYYANNYEQSTIRAWLNDDFYNTAFSSLQRDIILLTTVDNSAESTGDNSTQYACDDTQDKVFLLSVEEATTTEYGFTGNESYTTTRTKTATDYAKAQGAFTYMNNTYTDYNGNGYWWLRSPFDIDGIFVYGHSVYYVDQCGAFNSYGVIDTYYGVVPALKIQLN